MNPDRRIRRIAIVGGGISGWLSAVTLSRRLGGNCSIHVVEGAESPPSGEALAILPPVLELLRFLGVDQNDFIDKTQSTYCLGQRFLDWPSPGNSFWHPFGAFGTLIERRPFYHFWHKARAAGMNPRPEFFSTETAMALTGRFIFPTNTLGVATHLRYSLHVDASLAARYLRNVAERAGVIRLERKLVDATRREDGTVEELQFEDGGKLRADLFVDTDPRGQLIGLLGVDCESWQHLLPCDRILTAPQGLGDTRPPYMAVKSGAAGWQWRMPLQQIVSSGLVYSSAHQSDEAAALELAGGGAQPLVEPRLRSFASGRRRTFWEKNVVAVGPAAGSLEPLAITDLQLSNMGLFGLLDHFPDTQFDPVNIAAYNAAVGEEFERVRDFILLHYCAGRRDDTPFWQHFANLALPERLQRRIDSYRATGRVSIQGEEAFSDLDWFWILDGAGNVPRDYDPLVDTVDFEQVKRLMQAISQKVAADVSSAPTHDSFFAAANARIGSARKAAAGASAG
jgi:tryptophan halogenase